MDIERFKRKPILGILRGVKIGEIEPLAEAVAEAGLETLEVTMNTKGAADLIRALGRVSRGRIMVGAGTVLDLASLRAALDAGATFAVMPCLVGEVMKYCADNKIPAYPGALTPSEVYSCWCSGASMVKVFPAKCFGPEYFREIKGPFKDIELMAVGGVTPENAGSYFSCGASAIAIGASVFKKERLAQKDFKSISALVRRYIAALPRPPK